MLTNGRTPDTVSQPQPNPHCLQDSLHDIGMHIQGLDEATALLSHGQHPVTVCHLGRCNLGQHATVAGVAHGQICAATAWLTAARELLKKQLPLEQCFYRVCPCGTLGRVQGHVGSKQPARGANRGHSERVCVRVCLWVLMKQLLAA